MGRKAEDPQKRLMKRILKKDSGCWEWQGYRYPFGYGIFWLGGTMVKAHRAAWKILVGEIPEGSLVLHKCDNPPCVNPEHLFLGNNRDNNMDCYNKKRMKIGEQVKHSKLKEDDIRWIRENYKVTSCSPFPKEFSVRGMAKKFKVTSTVIRKILRKEKWKHVK